MNERLIRVLLVEDDEDDFLLARDLLGDIATFKCETRWAATFAAGREAIAENSFDICLIDYRLGERTGLELLRETGAAGNCRAPMILLTGEDNPAIDIEAMNAGAADYLIKGKMTASALERSIRYALERRRAEDSLKEAARRERAMIENALDVICTVDADGRFTTVNPACFKMWGYRPEELIGRKYIELVAPEDVLKTNETARKIMSGEEVGDFENCYRHKNGTLVHTMWTCYWSEGEQSIFAVAHDVTERKQVETERQVITEIIQGVSINSNLDDLLKLVHQSIGRAIYAENCFVALYDKKSELLQLPFWTDKYDKAFAPQKLGRGLTSYVFRRGRPAFLTEKDIRRLIEQGEIELIGTPPAVWLGVPLRTPTEVIGVLVVQHYEDETAYTKRDLELLASAGDQIAVAIERKRAEEAVQNSYDYLNRIINAVADPIFVKNRQHEWTLVNDAMCRILGREREELIGRTDYEFLPVAEAETTRAKDEAVFTTGKEDACEEDVVDSFGERRVTVTRKRLHVDKDGEQFVVGVVSDITANKRIEEVLKAGETMQRQLAERQSAILDALPAHICLLDPSGNVLEVNNEWKQFAAANDYRGMNYGVGSNYIATCENAAGDCAEGAKQAAEICRSVLSGDSSYFELEYPCHSPNEERWFKLSVTPLHREKAAGVVVMHINITERKRIEAELEQARDAALELVRMKSEFLANMSHEIRTPMNGVIGMTGVLLDTQLDEEQRDYTETIQTSADALLRIIDDILDFSKIEAGQLHFETIDFDLNEAVEGTVELLAERARVKEIELASLIYSDVPRLLRSDAGRLRQILTNLIGNAIKFTEEGEVTVSVSKQSETDEYVFLKFEVTDTGIGISQEAQKKLFQAFMQADGSTTRKYGGTGLGLTISKQLVEMMGGDIGIESEPGRGSTFWFTGHFEKQARQNLPTLPAAEASIDGLRVLIVDDNATNRRIFVHQTTSWGMSPTQAESGAQALETLREAAARNEAFDIAILDLMMPEMDGFELARRIKADKSISKTHLILLPSYGKRGHGQQARDLEIAAYLQKPVRQSQLYNCLSAVISEAGGAEEVNQTPRLITQHSLVRGSRQKIVPAKASETIRILVAEDNPVNQKVALKQLQSLGFAADVVADGRAAIEAVKNNCYDVVFMDCQMPVADGFEATAEIRRHEGDARHTTIIAMTAHALEGEREKCIAAGMDDYLSKPVKVEMLGSTLKKWLAQIAGNKNEEQAKKNGAPVDGSNEESLDASMLDSFRDLQTPGEPDIVTELVDLFLSDAGKRITAIEEAAERGDSKTIKEQAHAVKGAAGNVGALKITLTSRLLEENSLDISRSRQLAVDLGNEFEKVARILKTMRRAD